MAYDIKPAEHNRKERDPEMGRSKVHETRNVDSYEAKVFLESSAQGFNESRQNRQNGLIKVSKYNLIVELENETIELALKDLSLELGGASNRIIFLKHPQLNGSIYTTDFSLLNEFNEGRDPALTAQSRAILKKKTKFKRFPLLIILLIAVVLYGLFQLKGPVAHYVAQKVPPAWEQKLGEQIVKSAIGMKNKITDPQILAQLKQIYQPILDVSEPQGFEFEFFLVEDPTVNAFATPGGKVVIFTGLLMMVESHEELAGILAHEIAHVTRKHSFRNIIESIGLYTVVSSLFGDASGFLAIIADGGAALLQLKFSRDFERDADVHGWRYLETANIDPRGMVGVFQKFKKEAEKKGAQLEGALAILSTHPIPEERVEYLNKRAAALDSNHKYKKFDFEFKSFQANIASKITYTQKEDSTKDENNDKR